MNRRKPRPGDIYSHFKGKKYRVLYVALCTETKEEMVIYGPLQGEEQVYASSLSSFLGAVNRERHPDAGQEYRFELCRDIAREYKERKQVSEEELIMAFLELDENEERAEFLQRHRGELTDRFLTVAAESLEFAEAAEGIEERCAALLRFLKTKMKYESSRLR